MTEKRLIEVLSEAMSANGFGHIRELFELNKEYVEKNLYVKSAMEAMKQAVNEALEEAANKAEVQIKPRHKPTVLRDKYIPTEDWAASVYKESILRLKVK